MVEPFPISLKEYEADACYCSIKSKYIKMRVEYINICAVVSNLIEYFSVLGCSDCSGCSGCSGVSGYSGLELE